MSGQDEQTLYEMSGAVERMIYRNEKNQYTVLELDNGEELVTVVGCLPFVSGISRMFSAFPPHISKATTLFAAPASSKEYCRIEPL